MSNPLPFWHNYPVYVFFREGGFYPVQLKDDEDAIANAKINPGTLRVEDMHGKIVWDIAKGSA